MHNVEFKVELRDPELARSIAQALGATCAAAVRQTDTYFRVPQGRLKRREADGEETEYIFYDRANRASPRLSHFRIYSETAAAERFGAQPLPVWVVVEKVREVYLLGNVRIHLDTVATLGSFLEFEAMVSRDCNVGRCHEAIAELRRAFAPVLGEPIAVSYSDMLAPDPAVDAGP